MKKTFFKMKVDTSTVQNLRQDYGTNGLSRSNAAKNPIEQFDRWFNDALNQNVPEPNAMTLATASPDGYPSARIVLLKGFDNDGFVFYSNYMSNKAKDLEKNPRAALTFCWLQMERQIRIEGKVERVSEEESTEYFQSRPKNSQIGAWASPQSSVIPSRKVVEGNVKFLEQEYEKAIVLPRPEHWGGYRVIPHVIEFWQGRSSRLHDRLLYTLQEDDSWKIERLAP